MFKSNIARLVRPFALDRNGSVAVLFGITLIPILLGVGIGVDYGRALLVRERMADAADAAALAIGSWTDLSQAQLKQKAQQFFDANYPSSALGTAAALNVNFEGSDIRVSVTGEVPTTFMNLASIDHVDVGAATVVTKKERNIELALVLDTTGSMEQGGRMSALKTAANSMVNTLFAGKTTSTTLKIAVVPFSGAVNVGSARKTAAWLDTAGGSSIAKEDFNGTNPWTLYTKMKNRSWEGCVRERASPYELTDTVPTTSKKDTLFAPYFAPDEPDTTYSSGWYSQRYSNNYLTDPTEEVCTGSGWRRRCTQEAMSDTDAQANTSKYTNATVSSSSYGPDFNCSATALTPLTNQKSTVVSAINALTPAGSTVIPAGLLWGWRVLSPTEPFTEGSPYDDQKWVKAIVLLTDGENSVNPGTNGINKSVYNAFGFAAKGHLGSTSGSQTDSNLDSKTLAACTAVKNTGIRLYTIGFQVNTSSQNLLRSCASEPDMFYNSPSTSDLAGIFQDIAQGLGELRIAR